MKHTPKPWIVTGDMDDLWVEKVDDWDGKGNEPIGMRGVAHVECFGSEVPDYAVSEANAKLIAAAPELLEACKRTLEYFQPTKVSTRSPEEFRNELLNPLIAAIAKAEGTE